MTLLLLPDNLGIASVDWTIDQPSQANRAQFTGARRVLFLNEAPRWSATINMVTAIGEPQMRPMRAFIQRCKGVSGTFKLPATEQVQDHALGSVVVDGGGQTGFALATRGWAPHAYLLVGNFITLGTQLIGVDAQVIAGADGKAIIPLSQYIRTIPADGAPVEVANPYGVMSLADSKAGWGVKPGQLYSTTIQCEEAY
jgi:hypothetical protein